MKETASDRLEHYRNATEKDSTIKGNIVGVGAYSLFNTGWIGYNFLYEDPRILIDFKTEIGIFQLELIVDELEYDPILSWFNDNNMDIRNLIGKSIYIAPNEQFNKASISADSHIAFNKNNAHIIRSGEKNRRNLKDYSVETDMSLSGVQKMPLNRINNILRTDLNSRLNGENGWMKTEIKFEEYSDELKFTTNISNGESITWSFDNSVNDYENIQNFLDQLNLQHVLTEGTGSIWIKPVRKLHFTNRPDDTDLISDNETWTASSQPMNPEKEKPSIVERIKSLFTPTDTINTSSSRNKSRKAKVADTYSDYNSSCDQKETTSQFSEEFEEQTC